MSCLRLTALGGWSAQLDAGRALALDSRNARALLTFLALHPRQPQTRARLMALFWGESAERQAGQSLRRALYLIRRALGEAADGILAVRADRVSVNAVAVDALELQRLAREDDPPSLERALALYRGELLEGLDTGATAFEEWLRSERQRLFEVAVETAGRLLRHYVKLAQDEAAVRTAIRLTTLDPAQETVHRTLMRLYAAQGRRAAALRQYQICVDALRRELDAEPEAETTELYLEVLRGAGASRTEARPVVAVPPGTADSVPLIGREAETRTLLQALDDAARGRGRLVIIGGEAGIGKTRLLAELRGAAQALGARVALGQCHQSEQVLPFRPLIEALREAELPADRELVAALPPATRTELARLFPELGDAREASGPLALTWLFEALLALLGRAAEREPLVILLEDVHWADEMTLRLLAFAGRRLRDRRMLLAVTLREEEVADAPALAVALGELAGEPAVERLALGALSEQETRELVAALSHARARGARALGGAAGVWDLSDGNPFVIVETVREMLERGAAAEAPRLPPRVRELIEARLTRLAEPMRYVMAVAAVVGEAVDFALLSRAARVDEREAAEAVEHLVRRRILHSVGERLEFSHDRLRETAYAALLPARRRALHRVVGETLEALATPLCDEDDRLAHHFSQAGVAEKAVTYLARFAETARRRNALEEAVRSLDRGLALVNELPPAQRDRTYLDLLLRKGFLLALRARYHDSLALLAPHRERVEALGDPVITAAYCFRLGMSQAQMGNNEEAFALGRRAIEEGQRAGDLRTIGMAHYLLAFAAHLRGRSFHEGVEHARQSVAHLEEAGETHYRGLAYWVMAVHLVYLGKFAEALEATRQVAVIAEAFSEPRLWSFGAGVALVRATMGEWQEAAWHAEHALERATDTLSRVLALSTLGYAHAQGGDPRPRHHGAAGSGGRGGSARFGEGQRGALPLLPGRGLPLQGGRGTGLGDGGGGAPRLLGVRIRLGRGLGGAQPRPRRALAPRRGHGGPPSPGGPGGIRSARGHIRRRADVVSSRRGRPRARARGGERGAARPGARLLRRARRPRLGSARGCARRSADPAALISRSDARPCTSRGRWTAPRSPPSGTWGPRRAQSVGGYRRADWRQSRIWAACSR